jgi:hypothetical protein
VGLARPVILRSAATKDLLWREKSEGRSFAALKDDREGGRRDNGGSGEPHPDDFGEGKPSRAGRPVILRSAATKDLLWR